MKKIAAILLPGLLFPLILFSQLKSLTIEDATSMNRKLFPASLSQLQWKGAAGKFTWTAKSSLIEAGIKEAKPDTILKLDTLNFYLKQAGVEALSAFPAIYYTDGDHFYFTAKGQVVLFDLARKSATILNSYDKDAQNADLEPKTWRVAFTKGNNLYIADKGKETAVTTDTAKWVLYGQSVHRNEFGINKGTFWSPMGNLLAFYRMDESMVTDYPLVDISTRIAELTPVKYPMAGMKSHEVTVGVYNPASGTTLYLKTTGPKDQYLTNITWSPDEKSVYIAVLNREQDHLRLNQYNAETGDFVKTLFEETNPKYVEPLTGMFFLPGTSGQFIWQSQHDGYNHLYLYSSDGSLIRQLTSGPWVVKELKGSDEKGTRIFFMCNRDNPLDNLLYSCEIKTGSLKQITKNPGTHRTLIGPKAEAFLDSYSSLTIASQAELLDENGKTTRILLENKNPLADYSLGETSVFPIKNHDGTDLYCRLIKPAGFDPQKKYPVIIYVYGGPHSQMITDSWLGGGGFFLNYLASQGYIVFTLDNRGTSNRGLEFEQAIFRNVGTPEVSDQMEGVAYLKSLPWADSTRIGINGWSYGGFMTLSMFLRHPGVFKTAVAGGPVIDWKFYEVMYGERYMDTPESNPDGYKTASVLNYVKDLKGKVLIIQGYQDETVVPQNSLSFLKKCVDEGIQVDYFVYPGHEHNVRGKDRVHLNRMITDYFNEHLR
jgi:dipeptidyl-peptidase 4